MGESVHKVNVQVSSDKFIFRILITSLDQTVRYKYNFRRLNVGIYYMIGDRENNENRRFRSLTLS